jgi:hypothetical protein
LDQQLVFKQGENIVGIANETKQHHTDVHFLLFPGFTSP